jgi:hypothetical protein
MSVKHKAERIEKKTRQKARAHRPFVAFMARVGFAAKGVMYVVVGAVAARAAFGADEPTGASGALETLMDLPVGALLVGLVGLGLAGYVAWRLMRAIGNPEDDGIGSRLYSLATAVVHIVLLGILLRLLLGGGPTSENAVPRWAAHVLEQPLGRWIVFAVGAAFVAAGLWQIYKALVTKLDDELNLVNMNGFVHRLLLWFARLGMTARGVVFALIGISVVLAGWRFDGGEAHGVARVLKEMLDERYGQWLLAAMAVGLIAYGGYEFLRAAYRRVPTG